MTIRRFGNRATAGPFQILRAPEKITIIDPAKDPELPVISRNLIFMTTLICGLMIGVGLVLGSDHFDPRVRSQTRLAAVTGLPTWGRLPHAYPLSYGAIASYVNSDKEYDHDAIGGGRSVA